MGKKIVSKELGFGTLAAANGQRFMNKDGSANIHRIGGPLVSASDVFHKLTMMGNGKFILMVLTIYTAMNIGFALIYYVIGVEALGITPSGNVFRDFLEAFFFSTQCFTTIGFGRVNPSNIPANIVASLEGLTGLLSFAIATGLIYGRFSRPRAHLVHSENLLFAPYQNTKRAVMFRIASTRKHSILIDNTATVSMGINEEENGKLLRRFYALPLELPSVSFMNSSWTLVHHINEDSPLYGKSIEELQKGRLEIMVLFKAMEETTSQIVLERFSYFVDEMIYGAKFISAIGTNSEGRPILDLNKISLWEHCDLPPISQNSEPQHVSKKPSQASRV